MDSNKIVNNDFSPAEVFRAYVILGNSSNNIKKKEYKQFKKEDIELIANDNSVLTLKDKVKVTGKLRVMNDPTIKDSTKSLSCNLYVEKIEKQ